MLLFLSWVHVLRAAETLQVLGLFFFFYNFLYFFIFGHAGSSLWRGLFPSCGERGPLLVAVLGPLIAEPGLQ